MSSAKFNTSTPKEQVEEFLYLDISAVRRLCKAKVTEDRKKEAETARKQAKEQWKSPSWIYAIFIISERLGELRNHKQLAAKWDWRGKRMKKASTLEKYSEIWVCTGIITAIKGDSGLDSQNGCVSTFMFPHGCLLPLYNTSWELIFRTVFTKSVPELRRKKY